MRLKWFPAALVLLITIPLIFWACESEDLAEPNPNIYPETFISEISPGVTTQMAWYGTDVDGRVERFEYKWDDGEWVETATLSETFPVGDVTNPYADFEFANVDEQRTFYVRAIDNNEGTDPSAAMATMSPNTIRPETQILEGPEFGKTYGPDLYFKWSGVDKDGSVVGFEYAMDDLSAWTYVDIVDEGGSPVGEKIFLGLGPGGHIFYVRSVDELGTVDQTPAQVAFIVASGYTPLLSSTSPIVDGGGWFGGVGVTFSWVVAVDYYGGQLPNGFSTFALDDSIGYGDDAANMANPWQPTTSLSLTGAQVAPGNHTFYVKVRDTQNSVSKFSISFSAAAYVPTKGILVVNGVSPVYGVEITEAYDSSAYWGTRDVDFFDLFGSGSSPSIPEMPTSAANALGHGPFDYVGGGSAVTPDILKDYSTVVWLANDYLGDKDYWDVSPIYPFMLAGGNVILASRYADGFLTSSLTGYIGLSYRSNDASSVYTHAAPGLMDMTPFTGYRSGGISATDYYSMGAFTNNSAISHYTDDPSPAEGWYHSSSGTVTLLFYNDTDWSYRRTIGAWSHPNLVLGANEAPTLPVTGDATGGNFVLINGRHYGFNRVNSAHNFDFILTNFFGE